jgi:hypothetical protein
MTPKEKAYELCYKFMICNSYQAMVWHNARICALIAVDELIKETGKKYWYDVKKEIEKL